MGVRSLLYLDFEAGQVVEIADEDTIQNVFPIGFVVARTTNDDPSTELGGAWDPLGSQTIGATTVYYFERVAP